MALIRVLWIVGLSLVALALLSVAFVLFGMKCYLCMRGVWLLWESSGAFGGRGALTLTSVWPWVDLL